MSSLGAAAAAILSASSQRKQQTPSPCRGQVSPSEPSDNAASVTTSGAPRESGRPASPRPRVSLAAWEEQVSEKQLDESTPKEPQAEPMTSNHNPENLVNVVPSNDSKESAEKSTKFKSVAQKVSTAARVNQKPSTKPSKIVKKTVFLSETKKLELLAQQTLLQKIVTSRQWEWFSVSLILLNSIFIGVATQYMAMMAQEDLKASRSVRIAEPEFFPVLQVAFTVLFTFELGTRWLAEGLFGFWQTPDMGWNILDTVVVVIGLADMLVGLIISASADQSPVTVLRVVRVVRVIRVARIIRVMRFFRELRMMIMSIMNSFKSLLWVCLVLLILFYIFGTSFAQATTNYLETLVVGTDTPNQDLIDNFGTLDLAIVSLYMAMSGGNDWAQYFFALEALGLFYQLLFLVFITFAVFAVFNIVTGVFVDSALQSGAADRESVVQDEMAAQQQYLKSMETLFAEIDEDESGYISLAEFSNRLNDPRVAAYFNSLKLDVSDAPMLFELLDEDGSEEISTEQFVSGCQKLQGEARSLDTKIMQQEVKLLKRSVDHILRLVREQSSCIG